MVLVQNDEGGLLVDISIFRLPVSFPMDILFTIYIYLNPSSDIVYQRCVYVVYVV